MKFIHLSDLHIGKRVNGFSMLEDQKYILTEILNTVKKEKPNAVLIAGDIYDKSVAFAEAVLVFDEFLTSLREEGPDVFIISGNHDSGERLSFGSRIMEKEGVFLAGVYDGEVMKEVYGNGGKLKTIVHYLPFLRPADVRQCFPGEEIKDYNDALRVVIEKMDINKEDINILVAHQFITGGTTSDSEEYSVGGLDNVDASLFEEFDYVALGHLHGPQKIGREGLRYAGSPLKYSFSEVNQRKSITVAEFDETTKAGEEAGKPELKLREIELKPLRDMRIVKGSYDEIMSRENLTKENTDDYIKLVLTDEEEIPYVMDKVRSAYPNVMALVYNNKRSGDTSPEAQSGTLMEKKLSPLELFKDFYKRQNNNELSEEKLEYIKGLIEEVWEEEE